MIRMLASRTPVKWFFWRHHYCFPSFPVMAAVFCSVLWYCWRFSSLSSDVPTSQHLGSLHPFCIPVPTGLLPTVRPLWICCTTLALVQSFLVIFHMCHATLARRVIFLQATVNLFQVSQFAFGFWRCPTARFRSLRCLLSPPIGITAASSLGTS
jgi:hypothetical protein